MTSSEGIEPTLDLVRRYQQGEEKAGFRLIELYLDRVLGIFRLRFHSSPKFRSQPAGVLCDAFLTGVKNFDAFEVRNEASFIRCLVAHVSERITGSQGKPTNSEWGSLSYVPPEFRIKIGPPGDDLVATGTSPNSDTAPSSDADLSRKMARIAEGLLLLSAEHGEMIQQRNFGGLSWELIAEMLGLPGPEAARRLHQEAEAELWRVLGENPARQCSEPGVGTWPWSPALGDGTSIGISRGRDLPVEARDPLGDRLPDSVEPPDNVDGLRHLWIRRFSNINPVPSDEPADG